jgi:predicted amidohydrolase
MVKIAMVQMSIEPLNPKRNIQKAFKLLKGVFKQEPDFICFPEDFVTGPLRDAVSRFAQPIPGQYTEIFSKLALDHDVYVIAGSLPEKENGKFYNTSVLISPEGNIIGKYRKIFLWHTEKSYLERGWELPVFKTKFGIVGIEICWDLAFPEVTREFAIKGADIVFCPSYWSEGDNPAYHEFGFSTESVFIDTCVSARAIENELTFVFVNGCGVWQLDEYTDKLVGHTQIALPFYGSISKLADEERVLVEDVDLSICNEAKEIYSIINDLRKLRHRAHLVIKS